MPWLTFKAQGRIMKSVGPWRSDALANGQLFDLRLGSGKIIIFISHPWWHDALDDALTDPSGSSATVLPDGGAPDYQTPFVVRPDANAPGWKQFEPYERKDLKWRVVCAGVQRLIEQEALNAADVALWVDWQSLDQDDPEARQRGARSLLAYATLSDYMLVPTEEVELRGFATPEKLPGYGSRGWCRLECFAFSLWAEMQGREAQLYAIQRDGKLHHYPEVGMAEKSLPSGSALFEPTDCDLVKEMEDRMIEAYGHAIVEIQCQEAGRREIVDLYCRKLQPVHVASLVAAVKKHAVSRLDLYGNHLGAEGAAQLVVALEPIRTVSQLCLADNGFGDSDKQALHTAVGGRFDLHL